MQAEHGYSIEAQKEAVKKECRRCGWKVVDEYVDAGISGKEMTKRPELQRMLRDIGTKKFDVIMAWNQSRLSRNIRDYLDISYIAEKTVLKLYAWTAPVIASC